MKILLLQLKRIGDLILTTPAIAVLRKNFPDAHITLAVSNECAELLPAISNVDRVLIARRKRREEARGALATRARDDDVQSGDECDCIDRQLRVAALEEG